MCVRLPKDFGPIGAHFFSESMDGVGLRTQLMDDKSSDIDELLEFDPRIAVYFVKHFTV